jgi:hypothetical protein
MAGLVPAIHVLNAYDQVKEDVDARHKAGHDEDVCGFSLSSPE